MLSRTEVERLAAMAHELRPDWPVSSLCTWLMASHANRAYRDVAVALAWVAADTATRTPKRMDEAGPWWQAVRTAGSDATYHHFERCAQVGHTSYPAYNCSACRSEALQVDKVIPDPDPDAAEVTSRGADKARRALAAALGKEEA